MSIFLSISPPPHLTLLSSTKKVKRPTDRKKWQVKEWASVGSRNWLGGWALDINISVSIQLHIVSELEGRKKGTPTDVGRGDLLKKKDPLIRSIFRKLLMKIMIMHASANGNCLVVMFTLYLFFKWLYLVDFEAERNQTRFDFSATISTILFDRRSMSFLFDSFLLLSFRNRPSETQHKKKNTEYDPWVKRERSDQETGEIQRSIPMRPTCQADAVGGFSSNMKKGNDEQKLEVVVSSFCQEI